MSGELRLRKQLLSLVALIASALAGRAHQRRAPSGLKSLTSFLMALPPASRTIVADDVKLLIAWVSETAAAKVWPHTGQIVNAPSAFPRVQNLSAHSRLSRLRASYKIAMPPVKGSGYFGLVLAMIDEEGCEQALLLLNRLFRAPYILREPLGVITDIVTTGALLFGVRTGAIKAAIKAACEASNRAEALGVPLLACGQSMAGGLAQLQIAALISSRSGKEAAAGFLTFNAAQASVSIERLGSKPGAIPGINFSKDRDPGTGPHSVLPNRAGLQIYVHADGTGDFAPRGSLLSALLHPWEHLLRSFDGVDLGEIVAKLKLVGTAPEG